MAFKGKNITEMNVGSLIGEKTVIDGDYTSSDATRIDGEIKGNVTCKNRVSIGEKGKVTGDIISEAIMISGEVLGNVVANGKVEITSSGKVTGDITAKVLSIDENAVFNGKCDMSEKKTE